MTEQAQLAGEGEKVDAVAFKALIAAAVAQNQAGQKKSAKPK